MKAWPPSIGSLRSHFVKSAVSVANLCLPPYCPACNGEAEPGDSPDAFALSLCRVCRDQFALGEISRCEACALPLAASVEGSRCLACAQPRFAFERAIAAGDYLGPLRHALLRAKHAHEYPLRASLATWTADATALQVLAWQPDLVVAIPMHWARRWLRGVNHAEEMGRTMAHRWKLPFKNWLVRCRATSKQLGLSAGQRQRNLRRALLVSKKSSLQGKRILVIDDIMTTGSTCHAAARVLRRAGAAAVMAVVIARANEIVY